MIVSFDKPIGDGYSYKVTYKSRTAAEQAKEGSLGYGTAAACIIKNLAPQTDYEIKVYLKCDNKPGTLSTTPRKTTAKTLQQSK